MASGASAGAGGYGPRGSPGEAMKSRRLADSQPMYKRLQALTLLSGMSDSELMRLGHAFQVSV